MLWTWECWLHTRVHLMSLSPAVFDDTLKAPGARTAVQILQKISLFCLMDSAFHHGAGTRVREVTDTSGNRRRAGREKWCAETGNKDNEWTWKQPVPHHGIHWPSRPRTTEGRWMGESDRRRVLCEGLSFSVSHEDTLLLFCGWVFFLEGRDKVSLYSPLEFTSSPAITWTLG